jgi:uncharacterized protein (TIGR02246 family)
MKRVVVAFAVVLWAIGAASAGARDALKGLLDEQAAAWSRGDLDAFCSVYADDATFITPTGITKGRTEVLERYRGKYVDKAGMGRLTLDIEEVRDLGNGHASVIARWTLAWPDRPKAEGLTLIVFAKTRAGWRIVQDASM